MADWPPGEGMPGPTTPLPPAAPVANRTTIGYALGGLREPVYRDPYGAVRSAYTNELMADDTWSPTGDPPRGGGAAAPTGPAPSAFQLGPDGVLYEIQKDENGQGVRAIPVQGFPVGRPEPGDKPPAPIPLANPDGTVTFYDPVTYQAIPGSTIGTPNRVAPLPMMPGTRRVLPNGNEAVWDPNINNWHDTGLPPDKNNTSTPLVMDTPTGGIVQWDPATQKWVEIFAAPPPDTSSRDIAMAQIAANAANAAAGYAFNAAENAAQRAFQREQNEINLLWDRERDAADRAGRQMDRDLQINLFNQTQALQRDFENNRMAEGEFNRDLTRWQVEVGLWEGGEDRALRREEGAAGRALQREEGAASRALTREGLALSALEGAAGRELSRQELQQRAIDNGLDRELRREEGELGRQLTREEMALRVAEGEAGRTLRREELAQAAREGESNRRLTWEVEQSRLAENAADRQLRAAEAFAESANSVDPVALPAFLAAGGGNMGGGSLVNSLAGGGDAITQVALAGPARQLEISRDAFKGRGYESVFPGGPPLGAAPASTGAPLGAGARPMASPVPRNTSGSAGSAPLEAFPVGLGSGANGVEAQISALLARLQIPESPLGAVGGLGTAPRPGPPPAPQARRPASAQPAPRTGSAPVQAAPVAPVIGTGTAPMAAPVTGGESPNEQADLILEQMRQRALAGRIQDLGQGPADIFGPREQGVTLDELLRRGIIPAGTVPVAPAWPVNQWRPAPTPAPLSIPVPPPSVPTGSTGLPIRGRPPVVAAATGFNGLVTKPTTFLAGEAGPEQVNVTPLGNAGGLGASAPPPVQNIADPASAFPSAEAGPPVQNIADPVSAFPGLGAPKSADFGGLSSPVTPLGSAPVQPAGGAVDSAPAAPGGHYVPQPGSTEAEVLALRRGIQPFAEASYLYNLDFWNQLPTWQQSQLLALQANTGVAGENWLADAIRYRLSGLGRQGIGVDY